MPLNERDTDAIGRNANADISRISRAMSRMRVLIKSRAISRFAMGTKAPDLDASYIDAIELVGRGQRDGEVTIGLVAEKMRMDPSRASRVVSHLVEQGMFRREVSQTDARRSVIVLTDKGQDVLCEKRRVKLQLLDKVFSNWSDEEIAQFATLYSRFIEEFENAVSPESDSG